MHFWKSSTQFLLLTVTAQLGWADFYTLSGRINYLTSECKLNRVFSQPKISFLQDCERSELINYWMNMRWDIFGTFQTECPCMKLDSPWCNKIVNRHLWNPNFSRLEATIQEQNENPIDFLSECILEPWKKTRNHFGKVKAALANGSDVVTIVLRIFKCQLELIFLQLDCLTDFFLS